MATGGSTDLFTGLAPRQPRFNVPALATDSTLCFSFSYFVDDARFHTVSTSFAADMAYAPPPQIGRRHLYPCCFAGLRILDPELRLKEFA